MQALGEYYCSKLTKGALDVIKDLRKVGVEIFLVTEVFTGYLTTGCEIENPTGEVHANDVYTNKNGHYKGINRECSLTTSNGKAICAKISPREERSLLSVIA